jgi:hypothetical protein
MEPVLNSIIDFKTCFIKKNGDLRLTLKTLSKTSSSVSIIEDIGVIPAYKTNASMRLNLFIV